MLNGSSFFVEVTKWNANAYSFVVCCLWLQSGRNDEKWSYLNKMHNGLQFMYPGETKSLSMRFVCFVYFVYSKYCHSQLTNVHSSLTCFQQIYPVFSDVPENNAYVDQKSTFPEFHLANGKDYFKEKIYKLVFKFWALFCVVYVMPERGTLKSLQNPVTTVGMFRQFY